MTPPESPVNAALDRCAAGSLPANVALMQICLLASSEQEAAVTLRSHLRRADHAGQARLKALADLWRETPGAFELVRRVSEAATIAATQPPDCAKAFDGAALASAEGSVALYSLGRADLLEAATCEVIAELRAGGLLDDRPAVLDLGCGIGRFLAALAPACRQVTGIDVSAAMIAEAARRCTGLDDVRLVLGNGRDLDGIADGSIDLVLAVDSFPYLVAAGEAVVASNLQAVHRVLHPGGILFVANYAYRNDDAADRADLGDLARRIGFRLRRAGDRPFRLWDGAIYELERLPGR
jgi:SAM-dependent methyltransferase